MKYLFKTIPILFLTVLVLFSCKDQWEDHNALRQTVLSETLDQLVSSNTSLSKFNEYLKKTGYDKILASSKMFTVWAPSNDALSNLDQTIVDDTAKLKQFIGNHIAYQEYSTDSKVDLKIKMLNKKNAIYKAGDQTINGVSIDNTSRNLYCKNGILHVIKSPIYAKQNIWDYFLGLSDVLVKSQQLFLSNYIITFDVANSKQIGSNANGEPIYDTVWIYKNIFLNSVKDVSNEDSTYTFFVMKNDAFSNEFNKMKKYLTDTTSNPSFNMTNYNTDEEVFKDVVVRGKYTPDNLPDSFYSTNGIKIHKIDLIIDGYYEASNGSVFTVSKFDIPKENKITAVIIQGENYASTADSALNGISVPLLGIRARTWDFGGRDIYVTGGTNGHKTPYLNIKYYTPKLYTIKYNIYWRAINDFQSSSYTQKIAINPLRGKNLRDTTLQVFKFKTIPAYDINTVSMDYSLTESIIGSWTNSQFGVQRLYLVANQANSGSYNDPLVLDYFKLVPDFN